jgi:methylmalonyl-CoA/ethylmalonyl-CoA epimerase
MILKPLHIGISVKNLDESIEWYDRNLDFKLVTRRHVPFLDADLAFLKNEDMKIELFEYKEPKPLPADRHHPDEDIKTVGTKHIAFGTDDFSQLLARFRKNSVDIVFEKITEGTPMCYIRDNSGVLIEFIQIS